MPSFRLSDSVTEVIKVDSSVEGLSKDSNERQEGSGTVRFIVPTRVYTRIEVCQSPISGTRLSSLSIESAPECPKLFDPPSLLHLQCLRLASHCPM
jgi:hypothetical protein